MSAKETMWAVKGMSTGSACMKIPYKGFEISVAFDDSCGTAEHYVRTYIRIYSEATDVTAKLMGVAEMVHISAEDLKQAFAAVDRFCRYQQGDRS